MDLPAPSRNGTAHHAAPAAAAGYRVAALIPAFDCARSVADVVRGAARYCEHVLVVDDGSSDETAALARAAGAEVIRHEVNRGKGAALRSGLIRLLAEGFTHAFSIDGDGQQADRLAGLGRRERIGVAVLQPIVTAAAVGRGLALSERRRRR